jgi:hypothetical protein
MKALVCILSALSVGGLRVCGTEEPSDPSVATNAVPAAAAPGPTSAQHGGTMVMAGQYPVEVVPHASGEVYAYVQGGLAQPQQAEVTVTVPVEGGAPRPVRMRWNRRELRYEARVQGVVIVPGPVVVDIIVGPEHAHGELVIVQVAPAIVVDVHVDHPHDYVVIHQHGKHRKHRKHHGHGRHETVEVHVGGGVRY